MTSTMPQTSRYTKVASLKSEQQQTGEAKPRKWRDIGMVIGTFFVMGGMAFALSLLNPTTPKVKRASAPSVSRTVVELEPQSKTIERTAEEIAREQRLLEIEQQLEAARLIEEKEQRFEESFSGKLTFEGDVGSTIYAVGNTTNDNITVSCELGEFGHTATLSSSAFKQSFFKVGFLNGCTDGSYKPGEAVGDTLYSRLFWEQFSQDTGVPVEPDKKPFELAISGYTGDFVAPPTDRERAVIDALGEGSSRLRDLIKRDE